MELKGQEYIEKFFARDGYLSNVLRGYEFREAQISMAGSIFNTFSSGGYYCCEAGTGIGKTISYLLPAILWSVESKERVVVSTHTKNLQEQIHTKDLPLLSSILGVPFRYELIKGKGNYLCLRRWKEYAAQPSLALAQGEDELLGELSSWAGKTKTGDLSYDSPLSTGKGRALWKRICCDTYFCRDSACPDHHRCFLRRARRNAYNASIAVVNHSLLIADRMAGGGVLGDYACLIVDESQNLSRVARDGMKSEVDQRRLMWHVGTMRRLLRGGPAVGGVGLTKDEAAEVNRLCRVVEKSVGLFFSEPFFRSTSCDSEKPLFRERVRYSSLAGGLDEIQANGSLLLKSLERLQSSVGEVIGEMGEDDPEDGLLEVRGHLEMLRECTDDLGSLLWADEKSRAFWVEKEPGGKDHGGSLNAAPIDVAPLLKEMLFSGLRVGIFTSATLRIGESFDFFRRSIGLEQGEKAGECEVFSSPFYYEEQALVVIPGFLPDPREDDYAERLIGVLRETILSLRRGMLILFTSRSLLDHCYHSLEDPLGSEGIQCLGQGIDGTRDQITKLFREDRSSVLFGTDSFWEGVDVPGEPLELLVFTRLPFSVPTDPLSQAVEEAIRERGDNPFTEYFLPRAVMKFRQGFGRLIRSSHDQGIAMIMDKRVSSRRYGRSFVESLPVTPVEIADENSWIPALTKWWS